MQIDITDFFNSCNPSALSASQLELGARAGEITWNNSMAEAAKEPKLLDTEEHCQFNAGIGYCSLCLYALTSPHAAASRARGGRSRWLGGNQLCRLSIWSLNRPTISDLALKDKLYRIGMVVAVASTLLMGMTTDLTLWAV